MMSQQDATKILWYYFYEAVPSQVQIGEAILMFRSESGKLVLPTRADPAEMQRHRDKLIGADFRFTWQNLPTPGGDLLEVRMAKL